jgi:hypothetical protein
MSFKESPSSLNPEISADYLTLMKDKFKLQLTAFVADVLAVFRRYQTLSMQDDSLMLLDLETYTESVKTQLHTLLTLAIFVKAQDCCMHSKMLGESLQAYVRIQ